MHSAEQGKGIREERRSRTMAEERNTAEIPILRGGLSSSE